MSGWRTKASKERRVGIRGEPPPSILIVCEGTKTEPKYFKRFRLSFATVLVIGLGKNTAKLVDDALELKRTYEPDRCWCVFDRDSFPAEHVNAAFQKAKTHGCLVAMSNECFELWYLLHFDYIDAALSRDRYSAMLSERLGFKYEKNSEAMYERLLTNQDSAIRNAKRLLATHGALNPALHNPFTTVHLLVEELNKYRNALPVSPR